LDSAGGLSTNFGKGVKISKKPPNHKVESMDWNKGSVENSNRVQKEKLIQKINFIRERKRIKKTKSNSHSALL